MDSFRSNIYSWYAFNKRDLPWRETKDPYRIWLSEIILQQTRINQGLDYYMRFVDYYPTVFDLAMASEDEVLKLWQGLGYYSRARNLHYTAKFISEHYHGNFPSNYDDILKLKGVGEYTAAAIASIAFHQPYAVVDGNVFRVLSRYFGIEDLIDSTEGKKAFFKIASELITEHDPGMHNQAMMEFGALQCVPVNPDCAVCPVNNSCYAFINKQINKLPVKKNKLKIKDRYFNYFVIFDGDFVFLKKRISNDIWRNLFEFPMVEKSGKTEVKDFLVEQGQLFLKDFQGFEIESVSDWQIHQLSHQRINYRFIMLKCLSEKENINDLVKVNKKDIFNFAVPKLLENFINNNMSFQLVHALFDTFHTKYIYVHEKRIR